MSLLDLAKGKIKTGATNIIKGAYSGVSKQLSGILVKDAGDIPGYDSASINDIEDALYAVNPSYAVTITYNNSSGSETEPTSIQAFLATNEAISFNVTSEYTPLTEAGVLDTVVGGAIEGITGSSRLAELTTRLARAAGFRTLVKSLTAQIWGGTSHLELTVPLLFVAEMEQDNNGKHPTLQPIIDLLKLSVPKQGEGGFFLDPPGPIFEFKGNGIGEKMAPVASATSSMKDKLAGVLGGEDGEDKPTTPLATALSGTQDALTQGLQAIDANVTIRNNISVTIGEFLSFPSVVITGVTPSFEMILGPDQRPMFALAQVSFRTMFIPTAEDIDKFILTGTV